MILVGFGPSTFKKVIFSVERDLKSYWEKFISNVNEIPDSEPPAGFCPFSIQFFTID